jgi:transposase
MFGKNKRLTRKHLPEIRERFADMTDEVLDRETIIRELNLDRSTYYKWKKMYDRGGRHALKAQPIPGPPAKLTEEQLSQVWSWIAGKTPDQLGFDFGLWTRKIVRDLIKEKFGVEYTLQGVGKLLGRLGLSPQRPLRRAYQQNPDAVQQWKTVEYPKIREEAKKAGASIFFADEASVRSTHHSGTTWAPVGRTPTVFKTGARYSVNMISAISPQGEIHFDLFEGKMNSERFIGYLKKLLADITGPIFLIIDGVSYHKSKAVKKFTESTGGRLKIFHFPSYSPQLNPDEWVWNNVKNTQVGRKIVFHKSDLVDNVRNALRRLKDTPKIEAYSELFIAQPRNHAVDLAFSQFSGQSSPTRFPRS